MKLTTALQIMIVGCLGLAAHAAKVAPGAAAKINAVCLAQTTAAKSTGDLHLKHATPEEFCECVGGRHVREAKKSISDAEAAEYLNDIYSFYKPLNKSESGQARAAAEISNEMDFQVRDVCDSM